MESPVKFRRKRGQSRDLSNVRPSITTDSNINHCHKKSQDTPKCLQNPLLENYCKEKSTKVSNTELLIKEIQNPKKSSFGSILSESFLNDLNFSDLSLSTIINLQNLIWNYLLKGFNFNINNINALFLK